MTITELTGRVRRTALATLFWGSLFVLTPFGSLAAGTATVTWNPGSATDIITDYRVYYGVASGTYTNAISAGTATILSVSNLVGGATYYFAATAVDSFGLESEHSSEASALIPVNGPNQPPTLDPLVNLTFNENAGPQTVNLSGITSGATNEVQTLTVTASSSNAGLIPTPAVNYTSPSTTGSISFAPTLIANGLATVTVTVNDGAASNNVVSRAFTVTVNPVNQAPTLNPLADVTINESAGPQTVSLSGIGSGASNEPDTLVVTASSSNPGLIPAPAVNYTSPNTDGSITFTPVALANGSATITVTVNDGGASNNVVSRTFAVIVNPVNQAPTLNALANVTLNENAGAQVVPLSGIGSGAADEVQTLAVTASSSNPSLIPAPTVNYVSPNGTGSLVFTPARDASGSATVTVTVNDGGTGNNIFYRSFTVTVIQVSPRPSTCTYALSLNPTGFSPNAASGTFTVSTASTCVWSIASSPWISLSSTNGTGSYSGTFTVEENTGLARSGVVTVSGGATEASCTITQQALAAGAVALTAPLDSGTPQASPKQFSWTPADPPATKYYLLINRDGSKYLDQWIEGATNCAAPADLPGGNYTWAVQTWNGNGEGLWSTNSAFTIQAGVPNQILALAPSGVLAGHNPQRFTWKTDPAATRYELYIEKDGRLLLDQWFDLGDAAAGSAPGNFAVDVSGLGPGAYLWWVRGWSPAGYGLWCDRMKVFLSSAP